MLLKDARDEFLFDCECKHLAKGTIRNYKAETRFLVEFLELKQVTEVEEVKAHHIRDFMKQKQDAGSSACYVNDILKVCKTWFHYLVDEDYGLDLYSVSRLMGHVNISITQRYLLGIKDKDIVDKGNQTSPLMNL